MRYPAHVNRCNRNGTHKWYILDLPFALSAATGGLEPNLTHAACCTNGGFDTKFGWAE